MPLPKAVREAGQRADELIAAHQKQQADTEAQQGKPEDEATNVAPINPVTPDAGLQPEAAKKDTDDQVGLKAEDESSYKQRYATLYGKYQAEVPRMAAQIRELKDEISILTKAQQEASAAPAQTAAASAAPDIDFEALNAEFPEKLVEPIHALYKQVTALTDVNGKLQQQLQAVQGNVGQMQGDTEQAKTQKFWTELAGLYPDYDAVNARQDWRHWLSGFRESDGRQWQSLLKEAQGAFDAQGVADVFKAFDQAKQAVPTPPNVPPSVPSNVSDAQPPAQKKIWTRAEVKSFYDDKARGLLTKRGYSRDQIAEIDIEITAANAEGRIR